jgi:hypothetical protein
LRIYFNRIVVREGKERRIKRVRGKSGEKSISMLAILTNTIRYRYEIDASGIEAEPDTEYGLAYMIEGGNALVSAGTNEHHLSAGQSHRGSSYSRRKRCSKRGE